MPFYFSIIEAYLQISSRAVKTRDNITRAGTTSIDYGSMLTVTNANIYIYCPLLCYSKQNDPSTQGSTALYVARLQGREHRLLLKIIIEALIERDPALEIAACLA
jgi:hypothetical protein